MDILSWILLCATLVVGLLGALYLYFSVKYKYWKNKGVPHLEPTFPAGNVSDVVYSRKTIGEVYVEFYRKFKGDVTITMTDVAAQSVTFLLAGFETSATTMSFCLYELALNPDIQDRLREDIDTVLEKHDGNITYEAIQEMSYLDNVVSETLRKHPTAPFLIRECTKEYKIPDSEIVVDRGSQVVVPVMGLHYDPKYFPDPTRFDPDRFTEEVKNTRHHYSYLPFGEGPRICMGMRFALLQIKVGLISILSKYQFSVCEKTAIPLVYDPKTFLLFMKGGTWLQVKNRSK
ncbi:probable cytochrome P450 6a13 isoform X3 [Periplaneta americana]|uniref:probable cytochrome P450 6a13 isoform X3 n=1 Tax=Periplaneta americana TaxID=6978 RepID=UPI0037E798BA